MGLWQFFLQVFAPTGWPTSVAPEYGRYQLWDTIQQVTFFVNTVISKQAMMKFHGVGDPTKTPAEAAALTMGRDLIASLFALSISTPAMKKSYKSSPRVFRMLSEILNAVGHFVEILAAILTQVWSLLYIGPVVCTLAGTMGGAVRSVILQHFAKGGQLPPGKEPDFGDISLKESNQDKGGKIFGLLVGLMLLVYFIGVGSTEEAEEASLEASLRWFVILTILHILANVQCVRQLAIVPNVSPPQVAATTKAIEIELSRKMTDSASVPFWKRFLLPPGYPETVVKQYTRFRAWQLLNSFICYPKQIVSSMISWSLLYGVGNSKSTPEQAVFLSIFMSSIDCVMGLLTGLPIVAEALDFRKKSWFIYSGILSRSSEILQIVAALCRSDLINCLPAFYPLLVLARCMAAIGGTSGSRINGAIPNAMMSKEYADRGEIDLADINVCASNQGNVVMFPGGLLSIAFLYYLVFSEWQPSLEAKLCFFVALMALNFLSIWGQYSNLPELPGMDGEAEVAANRQPLLKKRETSESITLAEALDNEESISNMSCSAAGMAPVIARSVSGERNL